MELFIQQVLTGLATGGIYACLALAVVMIFQAIDHFNFAQGEMATFSTFVALQMIMWGFPFWAAFFLAIVLSFIGGVILERVIFAPIHDAPVLSHVIVFIALFSVFNSMSGFIWGFLPKEFPSPFPDERIFGNYIGTHEAGMIGVTVGLMILIFLFFKFTKVGLAMRAAAASPESARLVGVNVGWMLALGWGLASAVGAVGGMLIAPMVFLDPNMMLGILLYGFAGAVVGGLTSPGGAVIGGFLVGVVENLIGAFIPFIGTQLKLSVALVLIVIVLLVRPSGMFGRTVVNRV